MSYEIQKLITVGDTQYDTESAQDLERFLDDSIDLGDLLQRIEFVHSECDEQYSKRVDFSSLPTFGGTEPDDTLGVWSWDEDSVLIGDSCDTIVSREEYFA